MRFYIVKRTLESQRIQVLYVNPNSIWTNTMTFWHPVKEGNSDTCSHQVVTLISWSSLSFKWLWCGQLSIMVTIISVVVGIVIIITIVLWLLFQGSAKKELAQASFKLIAG